MVIKQGDIYWVQLGSDLEARIPHPHVVIQHDDPTVVVCALTSNLKRVNMPGNVLLEVGEGNLPKQSVVEVSKAATIDKALLGEYIGTLTERRVHQILAGIRFVQTSFLGR